MFQTEKTCLLCKSKAFSRNLCKLCYRKEMYYKRLDNYPRIVTPVSIETRVKKTDTCWLWIGDKTTNGYGTVSYNHSGGNRKRMQAHRYVYMQLVGPIPEGKILMHICDNPPCVNPAHLKTGTIAENNADTGNKRRHHYGLDHWNGRLSDSDVKGIRASTEKQAALARKYGVDQSHISRIKKGIS